MIQLLPTTVLLRVLATLLAIAMPTSGARLDPYQPDPRVDALHYAFRIDLTDDDDVIHAHTTADVLVRQPGVEAIRLNLVGKTGAKGMTVRSVTVNSTPVEFTHEHDVLAIPVPGKAAGKYSIDIRYEGIPDDGLIISSNRHGDRTFFGDNWPNRARHWLAAIDHPADKATCEFYVTAPDRYQVVASGRLVERTDLDGGRRLTHTATEVPLATKVMVIGVAQFATQRVGQVDGVSVETWVYPQDREDGFRGYRTAKRILEFFVDRIGPFPYLKLANVQSKTRYGGMENAGNIFYSEGSVSPRGTSESLLAHEIAHQWFGDSVTEADWYHIWLSEGFATYMAARYGEFAHGRDELNRTLGLQRTAVLDYGRRNPDSPVVDTTIMDLNNLLSTNSYQKGGWVLHMLRNEIGDDQFWETIQTYYRRHRDANALTSDLRDAAEDVSAQELSWFFDQWIFRSGNPELDIAWRFDKNAKAVNVEIVQKQVQGPYRLSLEVELTDSDGATESHIVEIESMTTRTSVATELAPTQLRADPNVNLLAGFTVRPL